MRVMVENAFLLCIDCQEKLLPVIFDNTELLGNIQKLLAGTALLEVPVVVARHYPTGLGDTIAAIRELTVGAPVVDKTSFSCYQAPEAQARVNDFAKSGRKTAILCGIEAHVCVLQTALDLLAAGFQVIYVTDCVGSRKEVDKNIGIKRALAHGALPATYESVLFELAATAKHPAFKGLSDIIK